MSPRKHKKLKGAYIIDNGSEHEYDSQVFVKKKLKSKKGHKGTKTKHKKHSLKYLKAKYRRAKDKYLKEKKRRKKYGISSSSSSESSSSSDSSSASDSDDSSDGNNISSRLESGRGLESKTGEAGSGDENSETDSEFITSTKVNSPSPSPIILKRQVWQHPESETEEKFRSLDDLIIKRKRKRQSSPIKSMADKGRVIVAANKIKVEKSKSRSNSNDRSVTPLSTNPRNRRNCNRSSASSSIKREFISHRLLQIVEGDATKPVGNGQKIVAHICNNAGGWGKGFVLAVSKRWKLPEEDYRSLPTPIELGFVQFVPVNDDVTVANMVAQTCPQNSGPPPIRYEALRTALKKVGERALKTKASVHMPKIGTGLSRGNWDKISGIINEELIHLEIPVFVYVFS